MSFLLATQKRSIKDNDINSGKFPYWCLATDQLSLRMISVICSIFIKSRYYFRKQSHMFREIEKASFSLVSTLLHYCSGINIFTYCNLLFFLKARSKQIARKKAFEFWNETQSWLFHNYTDFFLNTVIRRIKERVDEKSEKNVYLTTWTVLYLLLIICMTLAEQLCAEGH